MIAARTKDQIKTVAVLEMVYDERQRQNGLHGDAMLHLPDGTGPEVEWLLPVQDAAADHPDNVLPLTASDIQATLRSEYDNLRAEPGTLYGQLTRMHLVREEIAEAFECHPDDPNLATELLQVAALCVQWVEYLAEQRGPHQVSQES